MLVIVHDYDVAYPDRQYFNACLNHSHGSMEIDHLDIKLISDVSHLLQMRITRQHPLVCLDQDKKIGILAAQYGVQSRKPMLSPVNARLYIPNKNPPLG